MHPITKIFSLSAICLCLASCNAPRYQERNFSQGGYETLKVDSNEFVIDYKPGFFTNHSDLGGQEYIRMLRAAHVTVENGYQYFTFYDNPSSHPTVKAIRIKCYNDTPPSGAVNAEQFLMFNQ